MKAEGGRRKDKGGRTKGVPLLRVPLFVLLASSFILHPSSFSLAAEPDRPDGMAALEALQRALEDTIQRVLPSVVTIGREPLQVDEADGERAEGRRAGIHPSWLGVRPVGTGVVIKAGGLVLTNYHLTVPLDESVRWRLAVWLPGGTVVPAKVLAGDPRRPGVPVGDQPQAQPRLRPRQRPVQTPGDRPVDAAPRNVRPVGSRLVRRRRDVDV